MIGLDANVLVRYFREDDPVQFSKVADLLEGLLTPERTGYISLVALIEMVWVLSRIYGFSKSDIVLAVDSLLDSESLTLQNEVEVDSALRALESGQGSFNDALIAALGTWAGCDRTLTFDRKAARPPGVELL